jgi:hypothetical protein
MAVRKPLKNVICLEELFLQSGALRKIAGTHRRVENSWQGIKLGISVKDSLFF